MSISTPMLDKARSEELTSSEITAALRELSSVSGDGTNATLECRFNEWRGYEWHVEWRCIGFSRGKWRDCIEDALVAEADELRRLMDEGAQK